MLQVVFSFCGEQGNIDRFINDNFPEWDKSSDINHYRGPVSELIDEMGCVYDVDVLNQGSVSICFEGYGFDDDWLQKTFETLTALGMTDIYLNYADRHGEIAGYVDFSTGVIVEEQFNGGDIDDVSERLLGVLESWDTMSYLFEEEE